MGRDGRGKGARGVARWGSQGWTPLPHCPERNALRRTHRPLRAMSGLRSLCLEWRALWLARFDEEVYAPTRGINLTTGLSACATSKALPIVLRTCGNRLGQLGWRTGRFGCRRRSSSRRFFASRCGRGRGPQSRSLPDGRACRCRLACRCGVHGALRPGSSAARLRRTRLVGRELEHGHRPTPRPAPDGSDCWRPPPFPPPARRSAG